MQGSEAGGAQIDRRQVPNASKNVAGTHDLELTVVPALIHGTLPEFVNDDAWRLGIEPDLQRDRSRSKEAVQVRCNRKIIDAVKRQGCTACIHDGRQQYARNGGVVGEEHPLLKQFKKWVAAPACGEVPWSSLAFGNVLVATAEGGGRHRDAPSVPRPAGRGMCRPALTCSPHAAALLQPNSVCHDAPILHVRAWLR